MGGGTVFYFDCWRVHYLLSSAITKRYLFRKFAPILCAYLTSYGAAQSAQLMSWLCAVKKSTSYGRGHSAQPTGWLDFSVILWIAQEPLYAWKKYAQRKYAHRNCGEKILCAVPPPIRSQICAEDRASSLAVRSAPPIRSSLSLVPPCGGRTTWIFVGLRGPSNQLCQ